MFSLLNFPCSNSIRVRMRSNKETRNEIAVGLKRKSRTNGVFAILWFHLIGSFVNAFANKKKRDRN